MNFLNVKNYNMTEKTKHTVSEYTQTEESGLIAAEPAVVYGRTLYSYSDYLSWTDNKLREILNGIVYSFSAPLRKHAEITSSILVKASNFIKRRKGKCKVYHAPFDVRLPLAGEIDNDKIFNVVQPDICVICDPSKLDERGCIGAPDLIVEVISPSTGKRDFNEKYFLYEAAGVKEYWIVFPLDRAVTVFLLQENGKYDDGITYQLIDGETQVPVRTLEGLIIDLNELFEC